MTDLVFRRQRPPFIFERGGFFSLSENLGELEPGKHEPTPQALTIDLDGSGNYTPQASFTFPSYPEPSDPGQTPNSVAFDFPGGDYTPQASFSLLENARAVYQPQKQAIIEQGDQVFRVGERVHLGVGYASPPVPHTVNIEINYSRTPYTPRADFYLTPPRMDIFRIFQGDYTPTSYFKIPRDLGYEQAGPVEASESIGDLVAILAPLQGSFSGFYDYNVSRPLTHRSTGQQENAQKVLTRAGSSVQESAPQIHQATSDQQSARTLINRSQIVVDESAAQFMAKISEQDEARLITGNTSAEFDVLAKTEKSKTSIQQEATEVSRTRTAEFSLLEFITEREWISDQVNAFDKQVRHRRQYYKPIQPWIDYTPTADFVMQPPSADNNEPTPQKTPHATPPFVPEPLNLAKLATEDIYELQTTNVLTYKMGLTDYDEIGGSIRFTPAGAYPGYETVYLFITRIRPGQSHSEPTFHSLPGYTNPYRPKAEGVLDPIVYQGEVVFDYFADSDTRGLVYNLSASVWQFATPYCMRRTSDQEEARKPPPGRSLVIDDPRPPQPPTPPNNPATLVIPDQRSYKMANTITVTLEDLTPILMDNIRLEYDADGFAWSFSGSLLDPGQVDLVKPKTDGTPLKLLVTINSYSWTILSEKISHRREFSNQDVTVSGRGVSALLAAPYREPATGTQGSALTVAQLADTHRPVGWTINWQAADWLVPADSYSFQGRTSIQAIKDLAEWAGAIVYPDRSTQTINIKPRYPVLPFVFAGATPDVSIPESVILSMTYRQISSKFPNGVYVHGGEIGGEIGFCRLNGTAGDVLLETQQNPIMTDPIGLRALGERLLAGAYTQPEIEEFTTIMDGTTVPLLDLGTLLEIGGTVRGIVNKVLIEATRPTVKQTVRLGEDTQNAWQAFQNLLPADPLLIATLSSLSGKVATMTTLSGGVVKVRAQGTETPGSNYYIRSGQIQGVAPNLTETEIII